MFKLLLVALGAAVVQAGYKFSNDLIKDDKYFNFGYTVDADVVYTTTYEAADSSQRIGFGVDTWFNLDLTFELFQFYKHMFTIAFTPIKIIPYTHEMTYVRPAPDSKTVDVLFAGSRNVTWLETKIKHYENVKVCGASIVEGAKDSSKFTPECYYDGMNAVKYTDKVWKYDIGKLFGISEWYGY